MSTNRNSGDRKFRKFWIAMIALSVVAAWPAMSLGDVMTGEFECNDDNDEASMDVVGNGGVGGPLSAEIVSSLSPGDCDDATADLEMFLNETKGCSATLFEGMEAPEVAFTCSGSASSLLNVIEELFDSLLDLI